jgi:glycosyltransferase involved in cell wall biosynthesis
MVDSSSPRDMPPGSAIRVTHVITGLGAGGAQSALHKVVSSSQAYGLTHSVVSLTGGPSTLEAQGVPVTSLGLRRGVPDVRAVARLARLLRRDRPDVVQSWMYHADLLAGVAALVAGHIPVVWGLRHADVDPRNAKRLTRWTRSVCARLSGVLPARIVCCAESARRSHAALGYRSDRMVVIPNGFDFQRFVADPKAGARIRQELSLPDRALVVGMLARFHPDKDFPNFLAAARLVAHSNPDAVFVLAGEGVDGSNSVLSSLIDDLAIRARVRLLGLRRDVASVLSAMDVLALPSRTEAFPNVLGEAMACQVPCVATDCGDSREILGATGRIVPPRDPAALARAILELLALDAIERKALGAAALERVRERYDLRVVARRYAELYASVSESRRNVARSSPYGSRGAA